MSVVGKDTQIMTDAEIKQRIGRQFGRAANRYNQEAQVQLDIAEDGLSMLQGQFDTMLDIGCGTGRISRRLKAFSNRVLAIDLAEGMCQFACQQIPETIHWITADAESLPLQDGSINGVFSSMALQWCYPLDTALKELYRVMADGSSGVLAILSQGALAELNQCWSQIDTQRHVNSYPEQTAMVEMAGNLGFKVEFESRDYVTWHQDLRQVLASIKDIGANVETQNANHGHLTRQHLIQLINEYEKYRVAEQGLPLTYQVCFLRIKK